MYRIHSFERLISELATLRFAPRCALLLSVVGSFNRNLTEKCSARIFPKSPLATSLNSDVMQNLLPPRSFRSAPFGGAQILHNVARLPALLCEACGTRFARRPQASHNKVYLATPDKKFRDLIYV